MKLTKTVFALVLIFTGALILQSCTTETKANKPENTNSNLNKNDNKGEWVDLNTIESSKSLLKWHGIETIEKLQAKEPKKVIVDVYTSWCGPCKMLDKTTFRDPAVVKLMSDNFYSVKFNAEGPEPVKFKGKTYTNPKYNPAKTRGRNGQHTLTPTFGIRGYPSIIILDENMNIIDKASGYLSPNQMMAFLNKHI